MVPPMKMVVGVVICISFIGSAIGDSEYSSPITSYDGLGTIPARIPAETYGVPEDQRPLPQPPLPAPPILPPIGHPPLVQTVVPKPFSYSYSVVHEKPVEYKLPIAKTPLKAFSYSFSAPAPIRTILAETYRPPKPYIAPKDTIKPFSYSYEVKHEIPVAVKTIPIVESLAESPLAPIAKVVNTYGPPHEGYDLPKPYVAPKPSFKPFSYSYEVKHEIPVAVKTIPIVESLAEVPVAPIAKVVNTYGPPHEGYDLPKPYIAPKPSFKPFSYSYEVKHEIPVEVKSLPVAPATKLVDTYVPRREGHDYPKPYIAPKPFSYAFEVKHSIPATLKRIPAVPVAPITKVVAPVVHERPAFSPFSYSYKVEHTVPVKRIEAIAERPQKEGYDYPKPIQRFEETPIAPISLVRPAIRTNQFVYEFNVPLIPESNAINLPNLVEVTPTRLPSREENARPPILQYSTQENLPSRNTPYPPAGPPASGPWLK